MRKLIILFLLPFFFSSAYADVDFQTIEVCNLGIFTTTASSMEVCSFFETIGGGGGGGSDNTLTKTVASITDFDFGLETLSITHLAGIAQPGEILTTWNTARDLQIETISFDSSPFIIQFPDRPFSLTGDSSGESSGIIPYTIFLPEDYCEGEPNSNCELEQEYSIPVTIEVSDAGDFLVKQIPIDVSLIEIPQDLIFWLILLGGGLLAGIAFVMLAKRKPKRKLSDGHSKSKGGSTKSGLKGQKEDLRPRIRTGEKKPGKAGTARKSLKQ